MAQYVTVHGNNQWKKFLVQKKKKNYNNPPKPENIEIETGWWQTLHEWRSTKQNVREIFLILFISSTFKSEAHHKWMLLNGWPDKY